MSDEVHEAVGDLATMWRRAGEMAMSPPAVRPSAEAAGPVARLLAEYKAIQPDDRLTALLTRLESERDRLAVEAERLHAVSADAGVSAELDPSFAGRAADAKKDHRAAADRLADVTARIDAVKARIEKDVADVTKRRHAACAVNAKTLLNLRNELRAERAAALRDAIATIDGFLADDLHIGNEATNWSTRKNRQDYESVMRVTLAAERERKSRAAVGFLANHAVEGGQR